MKKKVLWALCIIVVLIVLYIIQYNANTSVFISNGKWALENHNYNIPYNGTENLYVITCQKPIMKFKNIISERNGSVSVTIPKNSKFIISLYANATVLKRWSVENSMNNNIVKYVEEEYVNPMESNFHLFPRKGESPRRQNFYFESMEKGNCEIKLHYKHIEDFDNIYDYYIKVNVKVE